MEMSTIVARWETRRKRFSVQIERGKTGFTVRWFRGKREMFSEWLPYRTYFGDVFDDKKVIRRTEESMARHEAEEYIKYWRVI